MNILQRSGQHKQAVALATSQPFLFKPQAPGTTMRLIVCIGLLEMEKHAFIGVGNCESGLSLPAGSARF